MTADLAQIADEKGIRYFLISFVDLTGIMRAKLVPKQAIRDMQKNGAGFAGFAAYLDITPADPDVFAIPDASSLIQLPWKPEVGWLAADLYMRNELIGHAPRNVLKRVIANARDRGLRYKAGVECEFFLISSDGGAISDPHDIQAKPCYDQQALMRRYELITEICDCMQILGWGPYQNDHEDANGQFEMNWEYDDALVTADRHAFFKYMVKSLAEKHGLRATFMPKPFPQLTGNGCHTHLSVWDLDGKKNLFFDGKDEMGISALGYNFLGGILHSAESICALTNPTVNSYKRISAPTTLSGSTWAPNTITYAGNNRTHMVRIPDAGRFELRLPDGATNPYLLQATVLACGLDGVQNKRAPGQRLDNNMYTEPVKAADLKKLPVNLLDALRLFDKSKMLRSALGDEFVDAYVKLKTNEWNLYSSQLTEWERATTLDC